MMRFPEFHSPVEYSASCLAVQALISLGKKVNLNQFQLLMIHNNVSINQQDYLQRTDNVLTIGI